MLWVVVDHWPTQRQMWHGTMGQPQCWSACRDVQGAEASMQQKQPYAQIVSEWQCDKANVRLALSHFHIMHSSVYRVP